jgi:hypothetical protein
MQYTSECRLDEVAWRGFPWGGSRVRNPMVGSPESGPLDGIPWVGSPEWVPLVGFLNRGRWRGATGGGPLEGVPRRGFPWNR